MILPKDVREDLLAVREAAERLERALHPHTADTWEWTHQKRTALIVFCQTITKLLRRL